VDADVAVRLDEAGEDPAARGVDDGRALGHLDAVARADRGHEAVAEEDGAAGDGRAVDGDDVAPDDGGDGGGGGADGNGGICGMGHAPSLGRQGAADRRR
jgi:hypothetical protein